MTVGVGAPAAASAQGEPPFSASAAHVSDIALAVTMITPISLQVSRGFNDDSGEDLLIYGEAMVSSLTLNYIVKKLARRGRPYTHSSHPRVRKYWEGTGDPNLSFYSGHSTAAFTAAVAGSLLFRSEDENARASVWGFQLALAGATANLRVRAGKHYYTDVVVGAIIGTGFGVLFPGVQGAGIKMPSNREWIAMGAGLAVGIVVSAIIPLERDIIEPLGAMTPVVYQDGGGGVVFTRAF